jgi:hypothetical protein
MKYTLITTLALLFVAPMTVSADNTPMCDRLDERTHDININGDFNFSGDEIILRDEEDHEVMIITEERELIYKGHKLELTPRGQQLVNTYYDTFEQAMDEFADLAGEAAGLGVDTALSVVSALLSGDLHGDNIERKIEASTKAVEHSADKACTTLGSLESIEMEMAEEIDGFEPVLFLN